MSCIVTRPSIVTLLEGSLLRLVVLSPPAGRTVRRLAIPPLPIIRVVPIGVDALGVTLYPLRATVISFGSSLVTLLARQWSLAWGQATSPPLQRSRVQLSARRVANFNSWPVLCRREARLQRVGGPLAPLSCLVPAIVVAFVVSYLVVSPLVLVPLPTCFLPVVNFLGVSRIAQNGLDRKLWTVVLWLYITVSAGATISFIPRAGLHP